MNPNPTIGVDLADKPPPDLNDPAVLASLCLDMAQGMDQQAMASRSGTALSGHPYPDFFFGQVAKLLRHCAEMLKPKAPPTPASPPTPPASKKQPAPAPVG